MVECSPGYCLPSLDVWSIVQTQNQGTCNLQPSLTHLLLLQRCWCCLIIGWMKTNMFVLFQDWSWDHNSSMPVVDQAVGGRLTYSEKVSLHAEVAWLITMFKGYADALVIQVITDPVPLILHWWYTAVWLCSDTIQITYNLS